MTGNKESATSITWTLFGGVRAARGLELYLNPELAGGSGFSRTRGAAGFPNAEIYRVDDASPKWNLARLFAKKVFSLSGEEIEVPEGPNQLADKVRARRLTVVAGRFSLNDYFDANTFSHDPRTQFLNWSFMDNGAWDYAADTRGYTWGAYFEYQETNWALRLASVLVPIRANGLKYDGDWPSRRGDNLEFEYRGTLLSHPNTWRLLAYENRANMGSYRETLDTPSAGMDVSRTRALRTKYGFGFNDEFRFNDMVGLFGRLSWNDGHSETWAFTEIDQAISFGADVKGSSWSRVRDNAGVAVAVNALSNDHKDYLAAGGLGFIVGDGQLNYAPEEIFEAYYRLQATPALQVTGDYQFLNHPAFNADRGPVSAFAVRLHYEM